ncbi:MAG TPA: hypothetical protein VK988_08600, partial [Acidimicrobiales bacterium]|nr:hypothetical protein [Acidimicrobiales bacterium]
MSLSQAHEPPRPLTIPGAVRDVAGDLGSGIVEALLDAAEQSPDEAKRSGFDRLRSALADLGRDVPCRRSLRRHHPSHGLAELRGCMG